MSSANSRHPGAIAPGATPVSDTRRRAPPRAAARVGAFVSHIENCRLRVPAPGRLGMAQLGLAPSHMGISFFGAAMVV